MLQWSLDLLPYTLLLIAVVIGWVSTIRSALLVLAIAIVAGLFAKTIEWDGLLSIIGLGLTLWLPSRWFQSRILKFLGYAFFLLFAVAMSNYWLPGFNNLQIYQNVQFAADSVPFSMYLNFDKTLVGLFIILFFKRTSCRDLKIESIAMALKVLGVLVACMLPIALAIHYVRFEFKFPQLGWIWILNNLFFVCLAEEGLFRGFVQNGLEGLLPKTKMFSGISIVAAATLFGLAHYKGGVAYVALAAVAGLFYGYAFQRTKRLEASIIVHFGLNLIHFLFFSYPALAT